MTSNVRVLLFTFAATATGAVGGCGGDKPTDRCVTAHGGFAVRYTKVEGSCMGGELTSGTVGVQSYIRADGKGITYENVPVGLKAEEIGALVEEYGQDLEATKVVSVGAFVSPSPAADGYCAIVDPTPVEVKLPMKPAMTDMMGEMIPALPALELRYQWSNVRFYVNAALPGTQFTADLAYTRDGCQTKYKVQALYPAHGCAKTVTVDGKKTMMADQDSCSACADPSVGRRTGSGISPDIETICDPVDFVCLPAKEAPSLRAQAEVCKVAGAPPPWEFPGTGPPKDSGPEAGPEAAPEAPAEVDAGAPADAGGGDAPAGSDAGAAG